MSTWTTHAARTRYRCEFCAADIEPGEMYANVRLTPWDHPDNEGFFTWRAHLVCRDVWQEHGADWYNGEWSSDDAYTFRDDATHVLSATDRPWLRATSTGHLGDSHGEGT